MGLSSLPSPSEGLLTIVIVNAAIYMSLLKRLFRTILRISDEPQSSATIEPTVADVFRSRSRPVRFGSDRRRTGDCTVCLARFEPEAVVNRLPCGHLFHKGCLETWLEYRHATCPLCRTHVLGEVEPGVGAATSDGGARWMWFW